METPRPEASLRLFTTQTFVSAYAALAAAQRQVATRRNSNKPPQLAVLELRPVMTVADVGEGFGGDVGLSCRRALTFAAGFYGDFTSSLQTLNRGGRMATTHVVAEVNEQKQQTGPGLVIAVPDDFDVSEGFPPDSLAQPIAFFGNVHDAYREHDRQNGWL